MDTRTSKAGFGPKASAVTEALESSASTDLIEARIRGQAGRLFVFFVVFELFFGFRKIV